MQFVSRKCKKLFVSLLHWFNWNSKRLKNTFFATISVAVGCRSKIVKNPTAIFHRCDIVYTGAASPISNWMIVRLEHISSFCSVAMQFHVVGCECPTSLANLLFHPSHTVVWCKVAAPLYTISQRWNTAVGFFTILLLQPTATESVAKNGFFSFFWISIESMQQTDKQSFTLAAYQLQAK